MKRFVWLWMLAGVLIFPEFCAAAKLGTAEKSEAPLSGEVSEEGAVLPLWAKAMDRLEIGHEPLKTDKNYVLLLDRGGKIGVDDGVYLLRDSVHVTDVARESLFLAVKLIDINERGEVTSRMMDFRLDGDGKTFLKDADGAFQLISEEGEEPAAVAVRLVKEKMADATVQAKFLQEIEQIAMQKAGLSETESQDPKDEKEKKDGAETDPEILQETVGDATVIPEFKAPPPSSAIAEIENRVKNENSRTVIEVVIPPSGDALEGEKKEVSEKAGEVVVSIESRKD